MLNDLQQRCRWTGCNCLWPARKGPASAGVCLSADPAHSCCAPLQWLPVLLTSPLSPIYNRLVPTDTAVLPIKTWICDLTQKTFAMTYRGWSVKLNAPFLHCWLLPFSIRIYRGASGKNGKIASWTTQKKVGMHRRMFQHSSRPRISLWIKLET